MVSPEDRSKLEKYLLPRYTVEVNRILKEKKINPEKERPYDPGHISNVLQGKYDNTDIEAAFWELYEARKEKAEKLEWNKNRLTADTQPA